MATDLDQIKKRVAEEQKEVYGDESVASGAPTLDGSDTDEMFKDVVGHEPETESIESEVAKAEREDEDPNTPE